MKIPILSVTVRSDHDTVAVRQRTRQIARLLGFDSQDQTRICTAVSEVARNALNYGKGGRVEFSLEGSTAPQLFIIKVLDSGPGIQDLDVILEGRYKSTTGMGLGLIGSRRLMDQFEVDTELGRGTVVWLKKLLPNRAPLFRDADLARLTTSLATERPRDAFQELQHQNQELISALEEIRTRQAELSRLNRELEDTNRGVVALYAELDEKADHLRRADELKSRFLSNMSHEFRSPLNSILALSDLLIDRTDGDLTSEQVHQVGFVKRAAQDLLELVNDLLDLAKVEAGKVEAKPIEFTVSNLFAALRGMLRPLFLNQSIDLVFGRVDHIPPIYSDEGKISQILRNFISNALKFTEKGEVRVSADTLGEDHVIFSVSDTGIGIAPENLDLIFQDFTQVDSPLQRKVKGTGLGLPLSKKLANFLHGEVGVESVPGSGSTFTLRVPLQYEEFPERQSSPALVEQLLEPGSVPILVLDDSPETMSMYQKYLRRSGFQIFPASTTREADEVLERIAPGAMVLDVVLRSENSWAFLAKIKADPRFKGIPVVVASTLDDQAKAYHLGANGYLLKPFGRAALLRELRTLMGHAQDNLILIIDDDERDRYLLKQHLRKFAATTTESTNGMDGIRKACEIRPDVIFLDLGMPGMTGFETLLRLKAEPDSRDVPVIIVTSQILTDGERSQLMQNAVSIVGKDTFGRTDLTDALSRMLSDVGVR